MPHSQLSHEWQGVWENLSGYLEQFSPPAVWYFKLEQVHDPVEVTQHLTKEYYVKEIQLLALCWVLAYAY